jgi:hypothetical protein
MLSPRDLKKGIWIPHPRILHSFPPHLKDYAEDIFYESMKFAGKDIIQFNKEREREFAKRNMEFTPVTFESFTQEFPHGPGGFIHLDNSCGRPECVVARGEWPCICPSGEPFYPHHMYCSSNKALLEFDKEEVECARVLIELKKA